MQRKRETLVVVRGGGDIATGTIQKLWNSGFGLVILETDRPTAIRRKVALSQAVYEGTATVEDLTAARIESTDEIEKEWEKGRIPLLVDPECRCLEDLKPLALVDAILAKKPGNSSENGKIHPCAGAWLYRGGRRGSGY